MGCYAETGFVKAYSCEKEREKERDKTRKMVRPVRGLAAAPLDPHWARPSHPDIQEVITGRDGSFASKSFSRIGLPPFAVFAKLAFPPCTPASEATYATVQTGKGAHLNLNSDLLYINHSCEPTLVSQPSSCRACCLFGLPPFAAETSVLSVFPGGRRKDGT